MWVVLRGDLPGIYFSRYVRFIFLLSPTLITLRAISESYEDGLGDHPDRVAIFFFTAEDTECFWAECARFYM